MIIVKLQGGLGNQMFQYAAGRTLALKHNTELKLDLHSLLDRTPGAAFVFRDYDLDIFPHLNVRFATKQEVSKFVPKDKNSFFSLLMNKMNLNRTFFRQKGITYQPKFEHLSSNVYLDGYWQSEKFFLPIADTIKNDFSFTGFSVPANIELKKQIDSTNSVCLNVRRGDFVNNEFSSGFHGFTGMEYINEGIRLIGEKVENPHFFIFSDDIEWCRDNIRTSHPVTVVDHSHKGNKFADYLQLMIACKHFIIPNSSFGWWAAWLSDRYNKTVIAPKKWFNEPSLDVKDIVPDSWIKI